MEPGSAPGLTFSQEGVPTVCAPVGLSLLSARRQEIILRVRRGVHSREECPSCVRPSWRFFVSVSSRLDSSRLGSSRLDQLRPLYRLDQLPLTDPHQFLRNPQNNDLGP